MKIPSNRLWTQTNEGDALGILHSTRNITLETPGKARLNRKAIAILDKNYPTANDMEYGLSIVYYDDTYIIVSSAGTRSFTLQGTGGGALGSDPTATIYGDGIVCYGLLHVTSNTDLHSYNGSTWTNGLETNTNSVPHPMEIFDALTTYKLAIGNANTVKLLDSSYNNSTAVLTLPSQYIVTTLAYSNSYLYVGTRNTAGGDAKIFIWDGNGNNANYEVPVSGNWVYSVKPYKGSVSAITSKGELIYVNGTTAERLGALPVFFDPTINWQGTLDDDFPRVFNRGMITDGDTIYLNVNAKVETNLNNDYLAGFESGIWMYTPDTGLNHFASKVHDDLFVSDSGITVSDSVITTSVAHNLKTGDSVLFPLASGASGIDNSQIYYASVLSNTTIKVGTSRRAVKDGLYVTINSDPDTLVYTPNTEYFQYGRVSSGCIAKPVANANYYANWSSPIIWSSSGQSTDMLTNKWSLNLLTDAYNVGFIETQRIYSDNIEQSWKKFYTFLDGIELENEKVIVKYRTEEELGYPTQAILVDWLNANTINITRSACPFLKKGDEVMIVDGYGRGLSAHIDEVNTSSNILSLVLDESHGLTGEACRVSFTNYKKSTVHTIENEIKNYLTATIDTQSPWVQVKVELRGFSPAVNMFDLSNEKQKGSQ